MKAHLHPRTKGNARVNPQHAIFELKHRVVLVLNKLADRDTYHIGVEELEKTAEGLTPEGVSPFLSCIIDTDSEQKSAVRKECIRIMGTLAMFHEGLLGPHLGKMVASIVKRLKDPDSVVRDACVEAVGILASKLSIYGGKNDGVFVVIVKPLFEALGEQNRQVQCGSALCLARVIDSTSNPPVSILLRLLTRVIKLLKNPHFMAKPAVIELIRSIIQVGGARTQNSLSAAMTSIQEALKNNDWTTRKAASIALGVIGASGNSLLGHYKASSIRSLESCRFDKVKPVRDSVLQALQYWKNLPGSDSPECSEAGSSMKENFCGGDFSDLTSASDGGWKDAIQKKGGKCSMKKRIPLTLRKACQNDVESPQHSKANDWHIELAVSKMRSMSMDGHNEESEGSCITKSLERMNADVTGVHETMYEYVPMDDKQECSSQSNLYSCNFETKHVTVACDHPEDGGLLKHGGDKQRSADEGAGNEDQIFLDRMQERKSLDSSVTELYSQSVNGCCSQTANEISIIRKHLVEIENKQSNLMDLLQVFMGNAMDNLSALQSKVLGLEHTVDRIAQSLTTGEMNSSILRSKLLKKNQSVSSSPRISTSSPRPSIDIHNRQSSLLPMRNREVLEEYAFSRSTSSPSVKQGAEMWRDTTLNIVRNPIGRGIKQSSGQGSQRDCYPTRKIGDVHSTFACNANVGQRNSESRSTLWQRVKNFLSAGNLDSAFLEALCSGDDRILVELLHKTGPVLDRLSNETVNEILSVLTAYLLDQRFLNSIIPWLHQVVELSATHPPDILVLSTKAKRELLLAINEAAAMDFTNPAERRTVAQIALKLHHIWGNCS